MVRHIDADALTKKLEKAIAGNRVAYGEDSRFADGIEWAKDIIDTMPDAFGVWLNVKKTIRTGSCIITGTYPTCNLCNYSEVGMSKRTRFCPNCGAKMEGGVE